MGKKNNLQGVKNNTIKEELNQSSINASNNVNNQSTSIQMKSKYNH